MPIHRVKNPDKFTMVNTDILKDRRLSLKAKGLLIHLLSYPDNWEFHRKNLYNIATDGRHSVINALEELKKCGYLVIAQDRDEKGKINYIWHIHEEPIKPP